MSNNSKSFLNKNLRFLRTQKDLQQGDMKEKIGVTGATWSNYENNVSRPDIHKLLTISNFFGYTMNELMELDLENEHQEGGLKPGGQSNIYKRVADLEAEMKIIKKQLNIT